MNSFGMSFGANQAGFIPAEWGREKSATFRTSPWIDSLNEALKNELAAIEIYRLLIRSAQFEASAIADDHAQASRKLAMLIIGHRGIPADRPAQVTAGFNKAILQICALMPGDINQRFMRTRLAAFEKHLCLMYASLAARAPESDREVLDQLGTLAADHHLILRRGLTVS